MTLSTATLERFTTVTSALTLSAMTEVPVTRESTHEERQVTEHNTLLYVTRVADPNEHSSTLVGTVVPVTASPSGQGWLHKWEGSDWTIYRLYGAPLNPVMENGHYYRTLNATALLARYNDEFHMGDRNIPSRPLSLIASNGTTWPIPNDGTAAWGDDVPYIEVEAPAAEVAISADLPEELMDARQFLSDITAEGPARGFAELDAAGRAPLNPAPAVGDIYIFWSARRDWEVNNYSEARMCVEVPAEGDPVYKMMGYWSWETVRGTRTPYWYSNRRTVIDAQDQKWVKMALTTAEETNTDTSVWTSRLATEAAAFTEFNEATNTLAEDNDWCSEYEGIVEPLGMEGRTSKVRDWTVEVSVDFSFEVDSVSGVIDRAVESDNSIPGISISSARFTGSTTITITVSEQSNEDSVRDYIDSELIEEELSNIMSGADSIDVDDYDIRSIDEQ